MFNKSILFDSTSTPKRRRLDTKCLRPSVAVLRKNFSPVSKKLEKVLDSSIERCESPPIPCNQYEYLGDTSNSESSTNYINSLGFLDSSLVVEGSFSEDHVNIKSTLNKKLHHKKKVINQSKLIQNEIEDISDEMFNSNLEVPESFCKNHEELLTSNCEKLFRKEIEQSFEAINHTISHLESNQNKENDLFSETKDSFLLDIKTNNVLVEHNENNIKRNCDGISNYQNSFYGLPLITKSLFKSCRNIEKLYDWQEECLNLDAITHRRNLIYALPTSGGKTLVAEVLMLREVLNRKKNTLFVLPFVAIVQEKIWSLSPFAVQLEFLVEEYAAGKGLIPPKKRRKKNSIYIATIEKALVLVRSLIELDRLSEIGLIVVDELHLIGEGGRGSTLETLLSTVKFCNQDIQIVGMSATIGNLPEIAEFLQAEVYEREFRPVQLAEYVKLGNTLHRLRWTQAGLDVEPEREIRFDYSTAATALDPDWLGGLVSEVTPEDSCLIFCPTKNNCENVAALLCKMQRREMSTHRSEERAALARSLSGALSRSVSRGLAYHHAGLASDERAALEDAFRSGVISVLCCTSTLAAGVNLPARRVIIRAPMVGRRPLSLAAYRQMTGRAGRAGHCHTGESIIICSDAQWPELRSVLEGGLAPALSSLHEGPALPSLALSAVALKLADTRATLRKLIDVTLLSVQAERLKLNMKQLCDDSIRYLLQSEAIEVSNTQTDTRTEEQTSHAGTEDCYVYDDTVLLVSRLGIAAIKGCMDLSTTRKLLQDIEMASRGLVLGNSLHLLYLVTPQDAAGIKPDYRLYYELYCNLDEECLRTASILGITEKSAIKMITGKPITNVSESVLSRFYLALILYDLWNQMDFAEVADKFCIPRGTIQQSLTKCSGIAASATRITELYPALWPYQALLGELAPRIQYCAAPELRELAQLPNVKKARAMQLSRAGYKRVEDLARASPDALVRVVDHLSWSAATHLVSAAKMMLIEKVENLRAEAEEVMQDLNL